VSEKQAATVWCGWPQAASSPCLTHTCEAGFALLPPVPSPPLSSPPSSPSLSLSLSLSLPLPRPHLPPHCLRAPAPQTECSTESLPCKPKISYHPSPTSLLCVHTPSGLHAPAPACMPAVHLFAPMLDRAPPVPPSPPPPICPLLGAGQHYSCPSPSRCTSHLPRHIPTPDPKRRCPPPFRQAARRPL